ncbi:MAG: TfoX/Sxy family protein, partial [Solobacterium sp.]|nr:TfoX/Sxy family protein [Solobacterium sp.]
MASGKDYLDYILGQCSELDDISYRPMMGEYILYYRGKVIGGIYDNRFLIKPTESAVKRMPHAPMELPYEGAK